jgi:6,7-dimethyl-8-ribityllumazine synthase
VSVREPNAGAKAPEDAVDASGLTFVIVAARFNEVYVRRLVQGAVDALRGRGAADAAIEVRWVPGSFELPLAARWAAESGGCDAVLAFGVLIEGETEHFRLVAEAATQGLMRVTLDTSVPVLHGVLAVRNAAQAESRCGGEHGNRGAEVALAAIRMAALGRQVRAT